ncbi:MAG: small basic protein [Candidatus Omnitrophica bacterium]|nr:small basic protein [Candidatus Omnitrophota bacterium]
MSIHRSLKSADTMKRHRSVLSRLERVRVLQGKGALDLETGSVLGLPKVKHLKLRIRKEKAAAAPGAEGAAAPAAGAAPAAPAGAGGKPAAAGAKPAAGGKPAAAAPKAEAAAKPKK